MSEVEGESLSCNVFGPTGQQYVSPGQRPGTEDRPAFSALKGRHIGGLVSPFQGFHGHLIFLPRAMPWADMGMPHWGERQIAEHLKRVIPFDAQPTAFHIPLSYFQTLFPDNQR